MPPSRSVRARDARIARLAQLGRSTGVGQVMEIGKDEWLTPQQVADLFGVSTWTVHRWEPSGKLVPSRLPSGHRRYRKADVDRLKREVDGLPASDTEPTQE